MGCTQSAHCLYMCEARRPSKKSQRSSREGERPGIDKGGSAPAKKASKGKGKGSKGSPRSAGTGTSESSRADAGDTIATDAPSTATSATSGETSGDKSATAAGAAEAAAAASSSSSATPDGSKPSTSRGGRRRSGGTSEPRTKAKPAAAAAGITDAKGTTGDPASAEITFELSMDQLRSVMERYEAEVLQWTEKANAVCMSFERKLGGAVARLGDKAALTASMDTWDVGGKGLKKVDFRRVLRSGLKLDATNNLTNSEIDKLFDSITGGGGGAVATIKEIKPKLNEARRTAATPVPEQDLLMEEAAKSKEQAATVLLAIEAVNAYDEAMVELNSKQGHNAPVIAQLGAIVIKRNLKLGEV